jgi:putative addiction module component (TIGR02574 family)
MVAKNLLDSVIALPIAERLELLDQLRESVRNDPALEPLSDDDRRILDKRIDDFELDPIEGSSWAEVEGRIRAGLARP